LRATARSPRRYTRCYAHALLRNQHTRKYAPRAARTPRVMIGTKLGIWRSDAARPAYLRAARTIITQLPCWRNENHISIFRGMASSRQRTKIMA